MYGGRPPFWTGWFGGPATRRFETSQRDAKTDVWMVWLQALSSAAILFVDLLLLAGWLYLVPHWVIYVGAALFALFGPPALVSLLVPMARRVLGAYLTACGELPPQWDWRLIAIRVPMGAQIFSAVAVAFVWLFIQDWCRELVMGEFPGKTHALWIYLLYAGFNMAVLIGTATAFIRWWAREVPDAMRPEVWPRPEPEEAFRPRLIPAWGKDYDNGTIHGRQGEGEGPLSGTDRPQPGDGRRDWPPARWSSL